MKFMPLLIFSALFALNGCSTLDGLKKDFSGGFQSIAKIADPDEAKKKLPVYDGTCPQVSVRPDLAYLAEFYDPAKTDDAAKVSEATITGVRNTCRVENNGLSMQIDISLVGKTGPKARAKPTDQPSFAYPYFVAVTDLQGTVLSKEIFAASLAYGKNQNELNQTESIFQNMPFPDATMGQVYNVIVGFQLSPEQLSYNQTKPSMPTAAPIKPAAINH